MKNILKKTIKIIKKKIGIIMNAEELQESKVFITNRILNTEEDTLKSIRLGDIKRWKENEIFLNLLRRDLAVVKRKLQRVNSVFNVDTIIYLRELKQKTLESKKNQRKILESIPKGIIKKSIQDKKLNEEIIALQKELKNIDILRRRKNNKARVLIKLKTM